jgi:hypothetical protein
MRYSVHNTHSQNIAQTSDRFEIATFLKTDCKIAVELVGQDQRVNNRSVVRPARRYRWALGQQYVVQ